MDRTQPFLPRDHGAFALTPRVSVIITWTADSIGLDDMLKRRLRRRDGAAIDTIVVSACPIEDWLAAAYPEIRFIVAPVDSSVARLRSLGVRHATGDVVMLVDNLRDEAQVDAAFALRTADGAQAVSA